MSNQLNTIGNEDDTFLFRLPREIIDDILRRLPPKDLIRFFSVSKRCKSIVSDPKFILRYKRSPTSYLRGLFFPYVASSRIYCCSSNYYYSMDCKKVERLHMGKLDGLLFYLTNDFRRREDTRGIFHRVVASSNGLILSMLTPKDHRFDYCVTNPLTKQSVRLPPVSSSISRDYRSAFATRESIINGCYHVSYKVVLFTSQRSFTARIFSSETGRWTRPISRLGKQIGDFSTMQDFCHKGILHWFDRKTETIITYDPYGSPNQFGTIRLPSVRSDGTQTGISLVNLGKEDAVRYCEIKRHDGVITLLVWRLDLEEWSLEQRCLISPSCEVEGWFLSDCRELVALDPSKNRVICYIYTTRKGRVTAIDLRNGKDKCVNSYWQVPVFEPNGDERVSFVPVEFCPWSSPLYIQQQ